MTDKNDEVTLMLLIILQLVYLGLVCKFIWLDSVLIRLHVTTLAQISTNNIVLLLNNIIIEL